MVALAALGPRGSTHGFKWRRREESQSGWAHRSPYPDCHAGFILQG